VEAESLYGILWHCPALVRDISLFCALRYKDTLVWSLHRKLIAIPAHSMANPIPVLVHVGQIENYPYLQQYQKLVFSIPF